ncbi:hypothetical protein, partial [Citrobacter freundii]|uniref:hypothetical protein n=1 Tax=Citrobacter freundii TaxID=546 RepID=UPI002FDBC4A6
LNLQSPSLRRTRSTLVSAQGGNLSFINSVSSVCSVEPFLLPVLSGCMLSREVAGKLTSKKLRPDLVMPITKYHNRALCKDENRQIERNRAA